LREELIMEERLPKKIEKPWGYELVYALTPKYAGKVIFVKKGRRLSLQYHEQKDESIYIYKGKALLEIEGRDRQMTVKEVGPGYSVRIAPGTRHRIKAIEDTTLLEVSTPELEDVVRVEDDYGRVK